MNLIYALLIFMGQADNHIDFRMIKTFESIEKCHEFIVKTPPPDHLKGRVACFTLSPYKISQEPVKDDTTEEKQETKLAPNEPCVIKRGFAAGKPCKQA